MDRRSVTEKYPTLKSASDILSATWNLAMTVFDRCTNGGYALPGQEHLWQAGLFQCKGEGFGVWLRDSVHIAMRGGNLIDPETAGRSLLYAVKKDLTMEVTDRQWGLLDCGIIIWLQVTEVHLKRDMKHC